MGRKSHKAFNGHHTSTNWRNVRINQGDPWANKYWRRYWKRKSKNEKRNAKRRIKGFLTDIILFLLFLAVMGAVFWLGMKK